jgi:cytochrome c
MLARITAAGARRRALSVLCVAFISVVSGTWAQEKWSYAGCPDVTSADFKKVSIVDKGKDPSLLEPIKMAIAKDGRVFFVERPTGKLKLAKTDGTVVTVATLKVFGQKLTTGNENNEMGLLGLVLDPLFDSNHYLYLDYAPETPSIWRISRFTLSGETLDLSSEIIMLEIPVQRKTCCHTGGGMTFDPKGDLWISLGNNTTNPASASDAAGYVRETDADADDQAHTANTNDLRGKIIRIHPTGEGKYTIPAGNLFPPGTDKTRPEIYAMGLRNPYTIWVDPVTGWLTWGDIGPDNGWDTEEYNLFKQPGFAGWPYFSGAEGNPHYSYRLNKDPKKPVNNSPNNTGLKDLPPARGAFVGYTRSAAVDGPIYHYNPALKSTKKLPPHFDGKWLVSDFNDNLMRVITLDSAGNKVVDNRILFASGKFANPLQFEIGPEGALYVLEYGGFFSSTTSTRISRMEYTGKCLPDQPLAAAPRPRFDGPRAALFASLDAALSREVVLPPGISGFRLYDLAGHSVWEYRGAESRVGLPNSVGVGVYRVQYLP